MAAAKAQTLTSTEYGRPLRDIRAAVGFTSKNCTPTGTASHSAPPVMVSTAQAVAAVLVR